MVWNVSQAPRAEEQGAALGLALGDVTVTGFNEGLQFLLGQHRLAIVSVLPGGWECAG